MLAKILNSSSSFNGVSYNTKKTEKDLGELMKVENFGYLQNVPNLMPEEYKNYLKAYSSINSEVKEKQFHAMISCTGREYDKQELTKIADAYMKEMGYSQNPYMVIFHKDTDNNHVHLVSSRIQPNGLKIPDSLEYLKSASAIQKIMRTDIKHDTAETIKRAFAFNVSSLPQFKLLLEQRGFRTSSDESKIILRKYDSIQGEIPMHEVNKKIGQYNPDKKRIAQVRKIVAKYKKSNSSEIRPVYEPSRTKELKQVGYTSDLADKLKRVGLDIVFHGKNDLPPHGYTIIDNKESVVFKGGEIMPLKEFIKQGEFQKIDTHVIKVDSYKEQEAVNNIFADKDFEVSLSQIPKEKLHEISAYLKSAIYEFGSINEGLNFHKLEIHTHAGSLYVMDKDNGYLLDVKRVTSEKEFSILANNEGLLQQKENDSKSIQKDYSNFSELEPQESSSLLEAIEGFDLNISDDVDDSQIHGRNRRREKKARINTR
ncbi:hypothetical protein AAKU52_002327 [Pedobacter sp. CG_S7]|uniref:relaxase/mobilization nuclease domain-containing protein n=1 Tax=Pedobacter sp. CG_S7 TaxID=3143930 RepID=UPI00339AE322